MGTIVLRATLLALILGGCATQAERQMAQMKAAGTQGVASVEACWAKADASPDGQALADLLPARGDTTPSMTLLTNKQVPSPEQAAALVRFHNEYRRQCQDVAIATFRAVHPAVGALGAELAAALNQGYAKLASREVSWGAYAQYSAQVNAEADKQLAALGQRIDASLQAQHSAEIRQRQAAFANAYNVYATQTLLNQNQQMINAYNRPRSTNCNVAGGFLNCTTY